MISDGEHWGLWWLSARTITISLVGGWHNTYKLFDLQHILFGINIYEHVGFFVAIINVFSELHIIHLSSKKNAKFWETM